MGLGFSSLGMSSLMGFGQNSMFESMWKEKENSEKLCDFSCNLPAQSPEPTLVEQKV